MNTAQLAQKIFSKPLTLVLVPIVYCLVVILAKWGLALPFDALWFFIGGLIGTYVITVAEHVVTLTPSPFRTQVFVIGLVILAFYAVTSTQEYIAMGMVILTLLTMFLFQISEWRVRKNLDSWYNFFFDHASISIQKIGLIALGIVFFIISLIFVFSQ